MVVCASRFKQFLNKGFVLLTLTSSLAAYAAPSKPINIRILGINDFHGQVTGGRNINNHPVGGAAVLASYIKAEQQGMEENTIITMSGDQTGAAPPASGLLKDEPSILFLNTLGNNHCSTQDRMAPQCNVVATMGNHEFDKGFQGMTEMLNGRNTGPTNSWISLPTYPGTNFPVISSNIVDANTGNPLFTPYVIKKIDGVSVGFIGAVLKDAPTIIVGHNIVGIKFLDEAQTINRYIPEMKAKGAEVIVVLIHQGGNQKPYEGNTQLSTTVEGPINDIVKQLDDAVDVQK
jgi:5'-nucleotidase